VMDLQDVLLSILIGVNDLLKKSVIVARRDKLGSKSSLPIDALVTTTPGILDDIHTSLFDKVYHLLSLIVAINCLIYGMTGQS
jgi:hypothetical protein